MWVGWGAGACRGCGELARPGGGGEGGSRPKALRTSGPRSNKQLEATYRTDMSYIRLDAICHTHIVLFCLVLILSRYDR